MGMLVAAASEKKECEEGRKMKGTRAYRTFALVDHAPR
jgi:hypothetical protein